LLHNLLAEGLPLNALKNSNLHAKYSNKKNLANPFKKLQLN
jgi:hypothetical protein